MTTTPQRLKIILITIEYCSENSFDELNALIGGTMEYIAVAQRLDAVVYSSHGNCAIRLGLHSISQCQEIDSILAACQHRFESPAQQLSQRSDIRAPSNNS